MTSRTLLSLAANIANAAGGAIVGVMPMVGIAAMDVPPVDIHGFASQGYLYSTKNNYLAMSQDGSAEFNEFGINFATDITNDLRLGMQIFARDLGDLGNDQLTLDWANADYHYSDMAGVRIGKIKLPLGLYNESREIDLARTSVLLPQSVYIEKFRDAISSFIGIDLYGRLPAGPIGSFDYQVYGGGNNFSDDSSVVQAFEEPAATTFPVLSQSFDFSDTTVKYLYGGQLLWNTPVPGLRMGASLFAISFSLEGTSTVNFFNGTGTQTSVLPAMAEVPNLKVATASIEYTWRDLVLASEYLRLDADVDIDVGGTTTSQVLNWDGWYVSAAYRFTPWFELGASFSHYVTDRGDWSRSDPRSHQEDAALSARFDVNEHWLIKLEGHGMQGAALVRRGDNLNDDGSESFDDDWLFFAAKTTVNF